MQINSFKDLYLAELQELLSAQEMLDEAQPRMAAMASDQTLKDALSRHHEQTQMQKQQLTSMLNGHGADTSAHVDQAMQALLRETGKMLDLLKDERLRDTGLVASAQKIAHYELAAFGSAAALAGQLDLRGEQRTLHEYCEHERQADARLTELAKSKLNPQAAA